MDGELLIFVASWALSSSIIIQPQIINLLVLMPIFSTAVNALKACVAVGLKFIIGGGVDGVAETGVIYDVLATKFVRDEIWAVFLFASSWD